MVNRRSRVYQYVEPHALNLSASTLSGLSSVPCEIIRSDSYLRHNSEGCS